MRRVNLNLLPHFDALIRTANVGRAAQVIGISQPAMSGALSRLRQLFQDPLLNRSGHTMVPTERAQELHRQLAPLLALWQQATEDPQPFAPLLAARVFTILASDYVQFLLLPPLAESMATEAPGIQLIVLPTNPIKTLQLLETNQVELAIGQFENPPNTLRTRLLHEEDAVCLLRRGHPALLAPWNIAAFAAFRHLRVTSSNLGNFTTVFEKVLDSFAVAPRVRIAISSYLAAPHIVACTDLVATVPRSVAAAFSRTLPVEILPIPVVVPPVRLALYWHERRQGDTAHQWLREQVVAKFARIRETLHLPEPA